MATIDTNPASGTRDFLPDEVARRQAAFDVIRRTFERYGFAPIDTPAFERLDVLLGKYGEEGDQLIFKILRRGEHEHTGEADLGLRYDLTVPLARYVARHGATLGEPFRRYHIAPVWRADRPQKGRFREFVQCDADTVGSDSLVADAETVLAVVEVLDALGLDDFEVQLNSRKAIGGLIEAYDVPGGLAEATLVTLDKLDKVGVAGVVEELRTRGVPDRAVEALAGDLDQHAHTERLRDRLASTDRGKEGLAEVDDLLALVEPHMAGGTVRFAPMLARGLSYYTGPIFEVIHTGLGSAVASGGRYDGLVGMFTNREIPATGGSIGIDRVLLLLDEAARGAGAPAVLVTVLDQALRGDALAIATRLRRAGIATDLFAASAKLGKQFKYADRRGVRWAVIRGSEERAAGTVAIKDLATGEQASVAEADLVGYLRRLLAEDTA